MAQKHEHHHDGSEHSSELSEMQLRVRALETVLTEKGYVDPPALDAIIEAYETKIGPHIGARVVAKAWSDPSFKRALLENGSKAVLTHAVLLLSMGGAWPASCLVQGGTLPLPRRERSARRTGGLRRQAAGGHQHSRLGLDRRDAVYRVADAASRH